jgi:hypothetical protein
MRLPTCYGITRTGPCRVSGQHLSDAPNSPEMFTQDELLAADKWRNADKAAALLARDEDALQLQVHMLRCLGAL